MRVALLSILAAAATAACSHSSRSTRQVDAVPANPQASPGARAVLSYLASLSTGDFHGAVVGQNCGHGSQAADPTNTLMSYDALVASLHQDTGEWQNYPSYLAYRKPIGFAEFGTTAQGTSDLNGTFDDRRYIQAIRNAYPEVAYFVAWHNWDWGDGTTAHQSLDSNQHAAELLADPDVIVAPVPAPAPPP